MLLFIVACDSDKKVNQDAYRAACAYFYGENNKEGYMLSSWGDDQKNIKIKSKMATLGLDGQWQYWKEETKSTELGKL